MIFSQYTTKVQQGKRDQYLSLLPKFLPLYQKYGIKFVGAFSPADAQDEAVWMTGFETQEKRQEQIAKLKQDPEYQKLQQQVQPLIVQTTSKTLNPAPGSPLR